MGLLAALAACGPDVKLGPTGDSADARERLVTALEKGPVRAQIFGDPYGLDPARQDLLIAGAIGEGVQGVSARFTADPGLYGADQPRLVVILNPVFEPAASATCSRPEQVRTAPATDDLVLIAAFCDRESPINTARAEGTVSGPSDQRLKRLLWQTGGILFPDDYPQTYGVDLIPGIDLSVGGSFGF